MTAPGVNLPYRKSQAIVLSRTDWRENDRILTLFSPDFGRVDALSRGCRKQNSPLMAASDLFCMGEYVLFTGKGKEIVSGCEAVESFYPLRLDFEKLSYASIMLSAVLKAAQPDEPAPHLFILLVRSLRRLAYSDMKPGDVTCAFLLHFSSLTGYKPRLNHCVRCGRSILGEGGFLMPGEGGIVCAGCGYDARARDALSPRQAGWLRDILVKGVEKTGEPNSRAPLLLMKQYVEYSLDAALPKLPVENQ